MGIGRVKRKFIYAFLHCRLSEHWKIKFTYHFTMELNEVLISW